MKTMMQFVMAAIMLMSPFIVDAQKECPTDKNTEFGQEIIVKQAGQADVKGNKEGLIPTKASIARSNPLFTFVLNDPQVTVPNNDCKDTTCNVCGWYKAFWIFGDGNYQKFSDDISHMDVTSHTVSHRYAKITKYTPAVYLTERYHNDTKPDAARISIEMQESMPTSIPVDRPVRLNRLNKRADIDFNNDLRKGYPTVFVLSHLNNDNMTRVLFFYNSTFKDGVYNPQHLMDYEKTEVPSYFITPGVDAGREFNLIDGTDFFDRFNSSFFTTLGRKFANCKEYSYDTITISSTQTAGLKEIRLFPVMNTIVFGKDKIPEDSAVVISVMLGNKPLSGQDTLGIVRNLVLSLFSAEDDGLELSDDLQVYSHLRPGDEFGNPEYIRGVAVQKLAVLASHDPNNLFVKKIDTLQNNRYRVSFSLRICNQGEMEETSPILFFHDLTGGHYATRPELIGMPSEVDTIWRMEDGEYIVTLNGFKIRGVPQVYQPCCRFVDFSYETDAPGVERLFKEDPRALKVCVAFSDAAGKNVKDCSENDVLKAGDLQSSLPADNNCWLLFFLFLLVLILIIYAWHNFQQNT